MKKLLSLLLAAALMIGLVLAASADEPAPAQATKSVQMPQPGAAPLTLVGLAERARKSR